MSKPLHESDMRFARMANYGQEQVKNTYAQRGSEYADTMEETQWLTLISVAKHYGITITNDQARAIAIASLCDIKYWRSLGGLKLDNLIDGGAYNAYLIGELNATKPQSIKDLTVKDTPTPPTATLITIIQGCNI